MFSYLVPMIPDQEGGAGLDIEVVEKTKRYFKGLGIIGIINPEVDRIDD